ncbi:hypothetical protein [Cupriavidus agavae]|uniref:Uncharacterized protein n=1 Tax=Cupriavidus agavae TaxID=1001822 RepID=A0A4Q7S7C3_9BURK|nr:hypothetical protein [Cupriavidus agavae]RZT42255.1 hypothetical protein EV147_1278 [Cupriavidus agavae]
MSNFLERMVTDIDFQEKVIYRTLAAISAYAVFVGFYAVYYVFTRE